VRGQVILYADQETDSIRQTLAETERRRAAQEQYNREHDITPKTVEKRISSLRDSIWEQDYLTVATRSEREGEEIPAHELPALIEALRREMREASQALEFERAAELRDRIGELESEQLRVG
jgi:excinuclease ABC subunit B